MIIFRLVQRAWMLFRMAMVSRKLQKSELKEERAFAQQALLRLMEDARGIPMKIGQILAGTDGDTAFQKLVEGIEPKPLKQMLPVLVQALGKPISKVFLELDESCAAASLGQVHRARLLDGTEVAVKIRYPDIKEAMDAELRLAGLMPGVGSVKKWGFELESYRQVLANNISRELDYYSEALRQDRFASHVQVDGLKIPRPFLHLCHESVLVQEWEQGVLLGEILTWPRKERLQVARTLLMTLFTSLFAQGEVHGDPHVGNTFYRLDEKKNPSVVLLDFGCVLSIDEERRLALFQLILGVKEGWGQDPFESFVAIGFEPRKLSYIREKLPALCRILFRPFLMNRPFDPSVWNLKRDMELLLGEQKWWFRSAGPADLFLLLRAFQGLVHQLRTLDVRLPWWPFCKRSVGEEWLQKATSFKLPSLAEEWKEKDFHFQAVASHLRIHLLENDVEKINMTLPAEASLELTDIIPSEILTSIQNSCDTGLEEIIARVRKSNISPQELFSLSEGNKEYRVWLE